MGPYKIQMMAMFFCVTVSSLAQTELHLSVVQDDQARLMQMVEAGADLNETMSGGNTALIVGAKYGRLEACKILLDKGAKINQANDEGNTPLMVAVSAGRVKIVQLLLSRRANVQIKNRDGMDARQLAELMGYADILKLFS